MGRRFADTAKNTACAGVKINNGVYLKKGTFRWCREGVLQAFTSIRISRGLLELLAKPP